jgi:hypothetical protein
MAALTDAIRCMMREFKIQNQKSEPIKAVTENCVICCGPHPYYDCQATDGNVFNATATASNYNQNQGFRAQGESNYRASNQMGPPGFPSVQNNQNHFNQSTEGYNANQGYNQNRGTNSRKPKLPSSISSDISFSSSSWTF